MLNQIAVFLENKKGRMRECCDVLKNAGINLQSVTIADTKDFGILRIITDNNDNAVKLLKEAGFLVSRSDLIGIEMDDRVGALADILKRFDEEDINIEYLYSSITKDNCVRIIFKTSEPPKATKILNTLHVRYL